MVSVVLLWVRDSLYSKDYLYGLAADKNIGLDCSYYNYNLVADIADTGLCIAGTDYNLAADIADTGLCIVDSDNSLAADIVDTAADFLAVETSIPD